MKTEPLKATIHIWSNTIGIDRKTLTQALARSGKAVKDGEKIGAREVFEAITGDKEAAMTRKLNAEAECKERENRLAVGEIVTIEEAAALYGKKISALVQPLDALPALVPGLSLAQRGVLVSKIEAIKEQTRNIRAKASA